ncbi:olfactory receptor 1-like [Aquarana catesbeiana]|uniref:olfactory receptor 1-like n=1 Tax=Aquarana catesbeiana TaxID=8400 RepID=UPI003CC953EF
MSSRMRDNSSGGAQSHCGQSLRLLVACPQFHPSLKDLASGESEPSCLTGIVATSNIPASAFVTKDDLALALAGLEGKIADLFAASSQEKLLIQSLTDLVRSGYKLPPAEVEDVSLLGSLKPPQGSHAFPMHPLLEKLIYADWDHPDKQFSTLKKFSFLYPMEKKFSKRWDLPAVDAAISSVNRSLTCPVDNIKVFRDPADKKLESLLKASFAVYGAVVQPAVAAISICQSLRDEIKQVIKKVPAQTEEAQRIVGSLVQPGGPPTASGMTLPPPGGRPNYKLYIFGNLLTLYFTCLLVNIIIITVIYIDDHLHTPMYLFLCNLSIVDICFTTVTVPKLLHMLLTDNNTISFTQCFTQFYFYLLFGTSEDILLFMMAYDRYVAICKPLHYHQILGRKNSLMLIAVTWISASINSLLIIKATLTMSFCHLKVIHQLFCDIKALIKISCAGTEMFFMLLYLELLLFGFVPFLCTVMSYVKIIAIILNINSRDGKRKLFSTCSPHLAVILLYYANIASVILIPQSRYSELLEQICTVLYTAVTPMLNPLIYTIRNKEVKRAMMRLVKGKITLKP